MRTLRISCISSFVAVMMFVPVTHASAQAPPRVGNDGLCTVTVTVPPPAAPGGARGGQPRAGGPGRGGGGFGAPNAQAEPPRLVKVKDDVYVIQNTENVVAQIGQFGGNVTIYLTDEGVILVDSKNERMHDDIVAKVKTLTDKPIKYVVLTHNHGDHSAGAARMQQIGATVVISRADRQNMARMAQAQGGPLPQVTYSRYGNLFLGGKEVQLTEYCGHTSGDTVAYLPAARVVVVGDLVTTPDSIPQIVNYGDGGNWTDMGKTLDAIAAMDFDFLVGGHGPVLSKQEFLKHRDKVAGIRERVRALTKDGKSQEEIAQTVLKEFNYTNAGQVAGMMVEFR